MRVKVVGDPGGGHPQWVRDAWLGVEFEAEPADGNEPGSDVLSGELVLMMSPWIVNTRDALTALFQSGRHDAFEWWWTHGYPEASGEFLFARTSCVLV